MTPATANDKELALAQHMLSVARVGVHTNGMIASATSEHKDVAVAAVAWVAFTLAAEAADIPKHVFIGEHHGNERP